MEGGRKKKSGNEGEGLRGGTYGKKEIGERGKEKGEGGEKRNRRIR